MIPANIYLFKVTIETVEKGDWLCYGVFIVDFEQIWLLFLVFLLLTLNKSMLVGMLAHVKKS